MTIEQKIKELENIRDAYDDEREHCALWSGGCCGNKAACVNHFKNGCIEDKKEVEQLIDWLNDYRSRLRKEIASRPKELYAIEHIPSGKIIFNARGGCYKHLDEAKAKLDECGLCYRIVTYKLQEGGTDGQT